MNNAKNNLPQRREGAEIISREGEYGDDVHPPHVHEDTRHGI